MNLVERANYGLHAHVVDIAAELIADRNSALLDVGCGTAALLVRLRERGYTNLLGLDIDPPGPMDKIVFHAVDLDSGRWPLDDNSVDFAFAVEIVEHIENMGALLNELQRVLKPGGRVLVTSPNLHSVEARLRLLLQGRLKQFDDIGDPTHIFPLFYFPFSTLVARHEFSIAKFWGFPATGNSPTSRRALTMMSSIARLFGLRGKPDGDQICLLLERNTKKAMAAETKVSTVTRHY